MPFYGWDAKFENLEYRDRRDLINTLNDNSAWKQIAAYIVKENPKLRRREWIDDIEREANAPNATDSAAELFLYKLRSRECDVYTLSQWLEACELFDALYIIAGEEFVETEELEIVEQSNPNANEMLSYRAAIGDTFSITCKARGLPPPKYQWFHENVEISGQTSSTFSTVIECPDQEGGYYCKISQFSRDDEMLHFEYSNYVDLVIKSTPVEITKQPGPVCEAPLGKDFSLICEAKGHPSPTYQWYKHNKELDGENRSTLQIKQFNKDHKGVYYCTVSNACTTITEKVEVKEAYPTAKATAKIALLIANSNYQHHDKLDLPVNDAALVAKLLEKIGFKVICLQNLTLKEMQNAIQIFCSVLIEDAYGLFYFAGHGFTWNNYHMMQAIDMPETLTLEFAYSQDQFLSNAFEKKPALLVVILDMCLTVPDKNSNPKLYEEKPPSYEPKGYKNLILAYGTSSNNPSYEQRNARNGVYVSHLADYITINKPAIDVFNDIANGVSESAQRTLTPEDQRPMITTVLDVPYRCLTDATIYDESSSKYQVGLSNLITFTPRKLKIKFQKCEVLCTIIIKFPNSPYMNVMELTTSGLEKYDVSFRNSAGNQAKLVPKNRKCLIYSPQRIPAGAKGLLEIEIGKNGVVHDSVPFPYLKYAPELLDALWRDIPESSPDHTERNVSLSGH